MISIMIFSYVFSFGNFLSIWALGSFMLIGYKGMLSLLMFMISYGSLILIGFLMVAPNGMGYSVVVFIGIMWITGVMSAWNLFLIMVALFMLVYLL